MKKKILLQNKIRNRYFKFSAESPQDESGKYLQAMPLSTLVQYQKEFLLSSSAQGQFCKYMWEAKHTVA